MRREMFARGLNELSAGWRTETPLKRPLLLVSLGHRETRSLPSSKQELQCRIFPEMTVSSPGAREPKCKLNGAFSRSCARRCRYFAAEVFAYILCCFFLLQSSVTVESAASFRQVFLQLDQASVLQPLVAIASDDDHLIVAGESSAINSAWAIKVDSTGGVSWTYTIGPLKEDVAAFHGEAFSPKFTDAVAMADGTTYLCGSMPRPPTQYAPGLLVHLDTAGKVLSKQLVLPKQRNATGIARINSCIAWGGGVALVGEVYHVVPHRSVFDPPPTKEQYPYPRGRSYWILLTDATGQIESEAEIHASSDLNSLDIGHIIKLPGSDPRIIFSATDNNHTEVVRTSVNGNAEAVRELSGVFSLVRPLVPDDQLQIFGVSTSVRSAGLNVAMLLDSELKEVRQVQGAHPAHFLTRLAYRLPDQSFVLFGSKIDNSGAVYQSQVARVTADLKSETDITPLREAISDSGSIWAATPIRNSGEFAIATSAIARDLIATKPEDTGRVTGFRAGAVVDLIQLK